jgi:hypothetical protein
MGTGRMCPYFLNRGTSTTAIVLGRPEGHFLNFAGLLKLAYRTSRPPGMEIVRCVWARKKSIHGMRPSTRLARLTAFEDRRVLEIRSEIPVDGNSGTTNAPRPCQEATAATTAGMSAGEVK